MTRFQVGDIVWLRRQSGHNVSYWPAKIRRVPHPKQEKYEIELYPGDPKGKIITTHLHQDCLIHFDNYACQEREAPIELYHAYRQAKRDHIRRREVSENDLHLTEYPSDWSKQQLRTFMKGLLDRTISEEEIKVGRREIRLYSVKHEESRFYLQNQLCQIAAYLLNQAQLEQQTLEILNELKQKMKTVIMELFMKGDL